MFEEVCLVCGKHLHDDGRVYCSSTCENYDMSSPSMSSASSALSSPHIGPTIGSEVPPLAPSALGVALKKHRASDRHSISSSSASSTSWSVPTDDEGEDPVLRINTEYNQPDGIDQLYDVGAVGTHPVWSAGLSYARLPSGTNNRSTVPHLHKRTASVSPGHVHGTPQSVPTYSLSSAEGEEAQSDFGFSSRDGSKGYEISCPRFPDDGATTIVAKPKRNRNRASLPAYFSLLQVSNSGHETRSSPVSSSSGHTIAHHSPPTPKVVFSTGLVHPHTPASNLVHGDNPQITPRGRRRVPGSSRVSRQPDHSSPHSRSRSRTQHHAACADMINLSSHQPDVRDDLRHALNWASVPCAPRGRNTTKRNGSPPPVMHPGRLDVPTNTRRGRLRTDELDDISADAPGYGRGRSGIVDRERAIGTRATLYY